MANQKGKRTYWPGYRECGRGSGQTRGAGENRVVGEEGEGGDGENGDGLSGYLCRICVCEKASTKKKSEINNCKK